MTLAFGASKFMQVFAIERGNAYQTNLQELLHREYVKVPPLYTEWFKDRYPNYNLPPAKTVYVLQEAHSIQGTRSAGKEWFKFSSKIFKKMGMVQNATDNAVFTFWIDNELLILLSSIVDAFLVCASTKEIYDKVKRKLQSIFDITTQEGHIINFFYIKHNTSLTLLNHSSHAYITIIN